MYKKYTASNKIPSAREIVNPDFPNGNKMIAVKIITPRSIALIPSA